MPNEKAQQKPQPKPKAGVLDPALCLAAIRGILDEADQLHETRRTMPYELTEVMVADMRRLTDQEEPKGKAGKAALRDARQKLR
jgi:hypothetical protein